MRSIWIIISTLAIANLLALAGFAGWLKATDRLNRDRIERVRTVFASTVEEERAVREEEERLEEENRALMEQGKRDSVPPLTAEQKLAIQSEALEVSELQERRIQRDTANLISTLVKERQQLDRERAEFQREVEGFNAMRSRIATEEGSEQFQKAVALYQTLKADQAKSMMAALIGQGEIDQVVAYLNALPPRNSSKILGAFEADDPRLAADLLERLRTHGMELVALAPPEG